VVQVGIQTCRVPNFCANIRADFNNCGACGVVCPTGSCVDGVCQPSVPRVLMSNASLGAIALDDTYVYVKDNNTHTIARIPKLGGPVETIGDAAVWALTTQIVVDGSDLVIGAHRMPKSGGAPVLVATETAFGDLTPDATDLYYVAYHSFGGGFGQLEVHRVPKYGGSPTTVCVTPLQSLEPVKVLLDATDVWFHMPGHGGIRTGRCRKDGSGITPIPPTVGAGGDIGLGPTHVFVGDYATYATARMGKDFSQIRYLEFSYVARFVVGNPYVYYWGGDTGSPAPYSPYGTGKVLACGGLPAPIYGALLPPVDWSTYPSQPVLDDQAAYLVKGGQLVRQPQ
jgi:hypothetical protein